MSKKKGRDTIGLVEFYQTREGLCSPNNATDYNWSFHP